MAKKKRGRWVWPIELRVKAKGKNLEFTFRVPAENVHEVFPQIERFKTRTKGMKRSIEQLTKDMR